ncbi:MAG: hypothetical protein AAGA56_24190, partial [Myxococcota bacterium]
MSGSERAKVDVSRFARMSVVLAAGAARSQVLADANVGEGEWRQIEDGFRRRMVSVLKPFGRAHRMAREELAAGRDPLLVARGPQSEAPAPPS